jgi:hypothetical protein
MNFLSSSKTVAKVVDAGSIALSVDTKGFNHASIDVAYEPVLAAGTASAIATVLRLESSDTNGSFANLSGFVGGTDFTIPTPANTSDTVVVRFDVDLKGRKRYLNVASTLTTSGGCAAVVRLSKGEAGPVSASDKGVSVQAVG